MPEKAKGIWTRCHGKLKETKCNAGKYQEIRAPCRRRDRIRASTGEYETDRGSNSGEYWIIQDRKDSIQASTEKRSYTGEYRKMVESRTFALDKVCNKRSFTDLLFFSAVTVLASASYSREFRDLSAVAQASALLAVVSCITSICLKRGLEDSGT
ncbi:hypothetical protein VitviT2T_030458 [Vitis vinifera]|uniref:Uncharacterized protein n=1 Tax=Vitis vinifera TaxID=29760 RepID=A0ABY9E4C4_VITVI|nr:hypothetical protein VitviT2T_030458 [Vitis vinifera]